VIKSVTKATPPRQFPAKRWWVVGGLLAAAVIGLVTASWFTLSPVELIALRFTTNAVDPDELASSRFPVVITTTIRLRNIGKVPVEYEADGDRPVLYRVDYSTASGRDGWDHLQWCGVGRHVIRLTPGQETNFDVWIGPVTNTRFSFEYAPGSLTNVSPRLTWLPDWFRSRLPWLKGMRRAELTVFESP